MIKIFEQDATNVNVKPGGLTSTTEIKILICYLLTKLDCPIAGDDIKTVLHYEKLANYFEVCNALAQLEKSNLIEPITYQDEYCYCVTENGKSIVNELERDVPLTVREEALEAISKAQSRKINEKENKVEIEELNIGFNITCTVMDGERKLMSVTLFVPDKECANVIKEKFLDEPSKFYNSISEYMTNDFE